MFCQSCGVNLGDKPSRFCTACGCECPVDEYVPDLAQAATAHSGVERRKLLWGALASVGLTTAGGVWYWGLSPRRGDAGADTQLAYTQNYPTDAKALDVFLEGDSFDTVWQGGPYYAGVERGLQQPIIAVHRQLKSSKVAEAVKLTQEIFNRERVVVDDVLFLQHALIELWGVLQAIEPDLRADGVQLAALLIADRLKLQGLLAVYEALPESGHQVVIARNAYRKSVLVVALAGAQASALAKLTAVALPVVVAVEGNPDEKLKAAVRQFEDGMARMAAVAERLDDVQEHIALLAAVVRQINTGEHYMGLAALEFARKQTPAIQADLQTISTNGRVSVADMAFMRANMDWLVRVFAGLETALNAVPVRYLLSPGLLDKVKVAQGFTLMSVAHASDRTAWERSVQALSMGAAEAKNRISSKVSGGWTGIKRTFQDAKGAVGMGIDGVDNMVKSGFDYALGKWEGNSDRDIRNTIADNWARMEQNLVTGESGADVLEAAQDYFDGLEEGGGDFAAEGVSRVLGEGNASWLAGHVGKITVNMFTGFGKGLAKIANNRASDGEVAEGFLDVGLSFIGGSKAMGKASQLAAGARSGTKIVGKKGLGFLESLAHNADLKKLRNIGADLLAKKKLTPRDIQQLISNAAKIEANDALKKSLLVAGEKVNKEFLDLIAKAGATLKENASAGVKQSYKEFTQQAFKDSLAGYKDALVGVLGNGFSDYIDNLVASKADDMVKTMVKEYIDRNVIAVEDDAGSGNDCGIFCDEESKKRFWEGVNKNIEKWPGESRAREKQHIDEGVRKIQAEQARKNAAVKP